MDNQIKVVISNGLNRFHLAPLAAEISKSNYLSSLVVAGWPIGIQKTLAEIGSFAPVFKRFLDRSEQLDPALIQSNPLIEIPAQLARAIAFMHNASEVLESFAMKMFEQDTCYEILRKPTTILHYRSCYGGKAVKLAKRIGIPTLCDHSIAHPSYIDSLVASKGQLADFHSLPPILSPILKRMQRDIDSGDHILVNSDFVRDTFLRAEISPEKISVIYLGVDEKFAERDASLSIKVSTHPSSRLLYAGSWDRRKGVDTLMDALSQLTGDWELTVLGSISPELVSDKKSLAFFARTNVTYLGCVSRSVLAEEMKKHNIFVFPSYCEGSARVVFEAMACDCFIITTPNSGSVVQNSVNGFLVPPGDASSLAKAIVQAIRNPLFVQDVGRQNGHLVRTRYTQKAYAENVVRLYSQLCLGSS